MATTKIQGISMQSSPADRKKKKKILKVYVQEADNVLGNGVFTFSFKS